MLLELERLNSDFEAVAHEAWPEVECLPLPVCPFDIVIFYNPFQLYLLCPSFIVLSFPSSWQIFN